MNLKKIKIISTIGIFLLCFPFHFLYDWLPNSLFSIFFPVNESIWEHIKMIFTASIIYGVIDYILLYKYKIKHNNFFLSLFISSLSLIPIFLLIFLPIYYKIGNKMIVTIFIMFVSILISQIISYYILRAKKMHKYFEYVSIIFIIFTYIVFGYLTYNPIKSKLFFDPMEEKYGINNYNI